MIRAIEIEFDECQGCQPYLKVANKRVKISMTVAAEILRRNDCRASVRKVKVNESTEVTVANRSVESPSPPPRKN
jgi:hypothetical protein